MPQKRRPARLWLRPDTGTWFIKDGNRRIATDCTEADVGAAQEKLAEYINAQYRPQRSSRSAEVTVSDVLMVYAQERSPKTARPKETDAMIGRLADFYADMLLTDIKGQTHREYVEDRDNAGGARRDLEVLRAAINYYHGENTLDMVPCASGAPRKGGAYPAPPLQA